ncbi:hypothetical protein JCM1841_005648 [Sporobolomyces salmonicolor]
MPAHSLSTDSATLLATQGLQNNSFPPATLASGAPAGLADPMNIFRELAAQSQELGKLIGENALLKEQLKEVKAERDMYKSQVDQFSSFSPSVFSDLPLLTSSSSILPITSSKRQNFPTPLQADIEAYEEELEDWVRPELTEEEKEIVGDSFLNDMPKLHECTIDKRTGEPVSQSSLKAAEKKRSIYIRKVLNGNKDWTQQEPEAVELCMRLAERDVPEFAYCVASNGGGTKGEGAWKSRRFVKLGFEGLVRKKRVRGKKAVQAAQEVKDEDVQPRAGKGKGRAREVESASEAAEDDEEMFDGDEDEPPLPKSFAKPNHASNSSGECTTFKTASSTSSLVAPSKLPTQRVPFAPVSLATSDLSTNTRVPAFAMPARGDHSLNSTKVGKKVGGAAAAGGKRRANELTAVQNDDDTHANLDLARLAPHKDATKRAHLSLSKKDLSQLCKAVNKPFTGKKEALQDRVLVAIAQYQEHIPEPVDDNNLDLSSSSRRTTAADGDATASEVDAPGDAFDE